MDISILTKRYSTPMYVKVIGTLLFPAVFILMLVLPVFELIPFEEYGMVFNIHGVASTSSYSSTKYTMFQMLPNDYKNGAVMGCFIAVAILCVICGIAFLWMNRAKLAAIPASIMAVMTIFSYLRSPEPDGKAGDKIIRYFYDSNHVEEFWEKVNQNVRPVPNTGDASGCVMEYKVDGKEVVFNQFGQYWLLWIASGVLLAFVIFAIVKTKTLIEKKK